MKIDQNIKIINYRIENQSIYVDKEVDLIKKLCSNWTVFIVRIQQLELESDDDFDS